MKFELTLTSCNYNTTERSIFFVFVANMCLFELSGQDYILHTYKPDIGSV